MAPEDLAPKVLAPIVPIGDKMAPIWRQKYWRQLFRLAPILLAPKVLAPKFPIGANRRQLAAGSPLFSKGTKRRLAAAPITANYWRLNKIGDRQSAPIGANRRQTDRQSAPKWRQFGAKLAVVHNRQLLAPIGANVPKNPVKSGLYWRRLAPIKCVLLDLPYYRNSSGIAGE